MVVAVIVFIQEGQRRIPIQYASRVRGRRMYQGGATFLPPRVNQAGVIPIIFAVSILLFPTQIASYFATPPGRDRRRTIADSIVDLPESERPRVLVFYFLLTMGFTYFYTAFTFKPDETADQLARTADSSPASARRADARLPRPGRVPAQPGRRAVPGRHRGRARSSPPARSRWGRSAASPSAARPADRGHVVVETMKQIEAQLMMRNYEGFIQ